MRKAAAKDLPALLEMEQLFPSDRLSPRQMRFHISNPRALFLVAEARGELAGYALFFLREGRSARFYSLVTPKKHRGRGHARALIEEGMRRLKRLGERAVTLEVHAKDARTIAFYERCGFVAGDVVPAYYEDRRPALRMRKDLT